MSDHGCDPAADWQILHDLFTGLSTFLAPHAPKGSLGNTTPPFKPTDKVMSHTVKVGMAYWVATHIPWNGCGLWYKQGVVTPISTVLTCTLYM